MNVKEIRRENVRLLANQLGGVAQIAKRLQKSTSQMSHLIGPHPIKNIGDRIAADIERIFEKPRGWLDRMQMGHAVSNPTDTTPHTNVSGVRMVPLLSWPAAANWPHFGNYETNDTACLPVLNHHASEQAFALMVENDMMESPQGLSIPKGSFIIIDPLREITPWQLVLVRIPRQEQLLFRQLVVDGGRSYLKPLNPRYPITAAPQDADYVGVITQLQMDVGLATAE